jgi:hypothetical protein
LYLTALKSQNIEQVIIDAKTKSGQDYGSVKHLIDGHIQLIETFLKQLKFHE